LGLREPPTAGFDLGKVPSVVQAHTRMENAQSRQDRARRMVANGSISPEDATTANNDYKAARAEHDNQLLVAKTGLATIQMKQTALAVAKQQLADTRVRVPTPTLPVPGVSGVVAYAVAGRVVAEGSLVRPGTEICKLVIDRTLKLRMPVPERYGAEVRLGQKAEVRTAALPRALAGSVMRINPTVDPATRTFEVEIQIPNPSGELKPGSFAKAAILTRLDAEAVTVPLSALVNFAGITKVFVAENGRAKEVQVSPGTQTTEWVEIASPALPRGTRVITSGQSVLADGSAVTPRAITPPAVADTREGAAP
jgi:RND family efflux transporter MFP subunit